MLLTIAIGQGRRVRLLRLHDAWLLHVDARVLGVNTHYVRRESCLIDINLTQMCKSEAIDIFLIITMEYYL